MVTTAITEVTPIMTPRRVRTVRSLCDHRLAIAILAASPNDMEVLAGISGGAVRLHYTYARRGDDVTAGSPDSGEFHRTVMPGARLRRKLETKLCLQLDSTRRGVATQGRAINGRGIGSRSEHLAKEGTVAHVPEWLHEVRVIKEIKKLRVVVVLVLRPP